MNYNILRMKNIYIFILLVIGYFSFGQSPIKIRPDNGSSRANYTLQPLIPDTEVKKAYDNNPDSYTTVETGISLVYGTSPTLILNYDNYVPANSPFYVKIQLQDNQLLDLLLGGYVGNLLSNVLEGLIGGVGNTTFTLKNGTSEIFSGGTHEYANANIDINKMRFVKDVNGDYYVRFFPGAPFKTLEVKINQYGLFQANKWINIYDTFYYDENSKCSPKFTYSDVTSSLLSVINNDPISNINYAIDNNLNTASVFNTGGLLDVGVGRKIEQVIDFGRFIDDKKVVLKLQIPSGLLNVNIASSLKVVFYQGNNEIGIKDIDQNILGADLLGLINSENNTPFTISVDPLLDENQAIRSFDKIGIRFSSPVNISLLDVNGEFKIYDVGLESIEPLVVDVCTKLFQYQGGGYINKFDVTKIIPNYNPNNFLDYLIVNEANEAITFQSLSDIEEKKWLPLGKYLIKGIGGTDYCEDEYYTFYAQQNSAYSITGKSGQVVELNSQLNFSELLYTTNLPNNTGIKIFDESNNAEVTNQSKLFDQLGTYNYYVTVSNQDGTCSLIKKIKIYVYDVNTCDYRYVQKHANFVTDWNTISLLGIPLGSISNRSKAGDTDLSSHSTITNIVSLLGIGTTYQDLKFRKEDNSLDVIEAGTPITIKLGQEFGVAQVLGAISLRAIDASGNAIGNLVGVGETDLLQLIGGDNVFEYTFIPTNNAGQAIPYSGVRVHLGSVLGLGNSLAVYGAYVDERKPISLATCQQNIIVNDAATPDGLENRVVLNSTVSDVLWGVQGPGIDAATALSSVVYPYYSVDNNINTYTIFNNAVSLLNEQSLTVKFKEIGRPGDKVRIILGSSQVGILNLNLLGQFKIQRYMGDVPVGDEVLGNNLTPISLNLLGLLDNSPSKFAILLNESDVPFDRVKITSTNIANVQLLGEYTHIYDVSLVPYLDLENLELCTDKVFDVEKSDICTTYRLSFAYKSISQESTPENQVYQWNDIQNSELQKVYETNDLYRYRIPYNSYLKQYFDRYLTEELNGEVGSLYLKVEVFRQNCLYGDAQYIKVKSVGKCNGLISNPIIRSKFKPY